MPKIADFGHFKPPWSLKASFAGHPVCGKMLGMWSSFTYRSMRWGCSVHPDVTQDFTNSPQVHIPPLYIFLLKKIVVPPNFIRQKMFVCVEKYQKNDFFWNFGKLKHFDVQSDNSHSCSWSWNEHSVTSFGPPVEVSVWTVIINFLVGSFSSRSS